MPRLLAALALAALATGAIEARAVTVKAATTVGLMQQPTSHYYLFSYGGEAELQSDAEGGILRFQYVERPEFRTTGFRDKDFGGFVLAGTKLGKEKGRGLYAFLGLGQMAGYTKSVAGAPGIGVPETRHYALNGPTAALEYLARLGPIDFALGHQTFVGFVDRAEMQAYVAWPYNFFSASMGYRW